MKQIQAKHAGTSMYYYVYMQYTLYIPNVFYKRRSLVISVKL